MEASPDAHLVELVRKYSVRGILLDTNILLMYVIGNFDPDKIQSFKRTNTFSKADFALLVQFLRHFRIIAATPHILTEVSNLAANLAEPQKTACHRSFAKDINSIIEHTDAAISLSEKLMFDRFGMTDTAIASAATKKFLVLTDDLKLYCHLVSEGIDAINFNHIRPVG